MVWNPCWAGDVGVPTDDRRSYVVVHREAGSSGTIRIAFSDR